MTVRTEQVGFYFRDLHECWDEMSARPPATALKRLPPDKVAQFKAELVKAVASAVTDQGIFHNSPLNIASGRKA